MSYHAQFIVLTQSKVAGIRRRSVAKYSKDGKRLIEPARPLEFSLAEFRAWVLQKFQGREDGVGKCDYCGCLLTVATFVPDHDQPLAKGGRNTLSNLVICCESCNDTKGSMSGRWFRYLLRCLNEMPEAESSNVRERLKKSEKLANSVRNLRFFNRKLQPNTTTEERAR